MEHVVGIQVRTLSHRLPCKAFLDFQGLPLIGYIVQSLLRQFSVDSIFALTTKEASDSFLASYLRERYGIGVIRGDTQDVRSRYLTLIQDFEPKSVVRLTGDNPFVPPSLIAEGLDFFSTNQLSYLSNKLTQDYPKGLDFEIFAPQALLARSRLPASAYEKEHVTPGLIRLAESGQLSAGKVTCLVEDKNQFLYTIDTAEDYLRCATMLSSSPQNIRDLSEPNVFEFSLYSATDPASEERRAW